MRQPQPKKKRDFLSKSVTEFGTLCRNMKLRFQNEIALPKIYTGPDMYFFLKSRQKSNTSRVNSHNEKYISGVFGASTKISLCGSSISIWHLPDRDLV
jgi:hypothetical protein